MGSEVVARRLDQPPPDPRANDIVTDAEARCGSGNRVASVRVLVRERVHAWPVVDHAFDSVLSSRCSDQVLFPRETRSGT